MVVVNVALVVVVTQAQAVQVLVVQAAVVLVHRLIELLTSECVCGSIIEMIKYNRCVLII